MTIFRLSLFALLFIALSAFPDSASGQLVDKLMRRTSQKLANEVERMAVEKLSDIIAEQATKQIEKKFDELLMSALESDSTRNSDYNRDSAMYRMGASYGAFLQGLNDAADLPETYQFDINMLVEMTNEGDDPQNMRMYYSRTQPIFGVQTAASETNSQLVVMDFEKDVMVMYHDDNGEKTAQAIPNVMKFTSSLAGKVEVDSADNYTITPIKKTQKIAGFKCYGYEGVSDKHRFEAWMTDELDIEWRETFGAMMKDFASTDVYNDTWGELKGVALKQDMYDRSTDSITSSMLVKEVDTNKVTITNADYSFGKMQTSGE